MPPAFHVCCASPDREGSYEKKKKKNQRRPLTMDTVALKYMNARPTDPLPFRPRSLNTRFFERFPLTLPAGHK